MEQELYHIVNRGVDKRVIFMDNRDYYRFVHDLFEFNDVVNVDSNIGKIFYKTTSIGTFHKTRARTLLVTIHAFCLMPNHYHLLVSPLVKNGVSLFMKKLNGGYAKYFNERYTRTGALFQGKYKSVPIVGDPHFSYILYYIHFNPLDLKFPKWRTRNLYDHQKALSYLNTYRWSSHLDYFGKKNFPSITQRDFMLDFFDGVKKYRASIKKTLGGFSVEELHSLTLE